MSYYRLKPVIITLDETPSTNSFASDLIKSSQVENGTCIVAYSQTSGKGQRGNQWHSSPWQNLTCSVIYYPKLEADKMFYLNIITSLAAADILEKITARQIQIKWPNDILIRTKKVAGILIENQLKGTKIHCSVIGIGININQTEFSNEINATSIKLETGNSFAIEDVLTEFHCRLDHYIKYLEEKEFNLLKEKYYQRLFGFREEKKFKDSTGEFIGTVTGINEQGNLMVRKKNAVEIQSYDLKEIQFIIQAV